MARTSFGEQLRRYRELAGLTQEQLAEQAGLTAKAVGALERGERQRPYPTTVQLLATALKLSDDQRAALIATLQCGPKAAPAESPPSPPSVTPAPRLPTYPTPFVGRETELATLQRLLNNPVCRLVTLVGPGGVGKTRLALEVAAGCDHFADGVAFVPLASVRNTDELVLALADVLGVVLYGHTDPVEQLLHYLQAKHLLLVLDNLEHLLESTAVLTALLQAPHLTLLGTSQERLNLQSEWVVELAGLPVPDDMQEGLPCSAAVALFVERARRVQANFTLTLANARAVVQICRAVEGLPLGIELAATWVRILSCAEIAAELGRNLAFLHTTMRDVPARHRSMQAVVAHSWTLLGEQQQQVLRRLAVFRGGFERAAAEQVSGATLPILAVLVDKSLLRREPDGRYQLHELLRQYAEEQLKAAGEAERLWTAHSAYYLDFLHHREPDLKGRRQLAASREIEANVDNIRTAWHWALQHSNERAINRAVESLYLFFAMHSRYLEGVELFRLARECLAPPQHAPPLLWARVLARLAFLQVLALPASEHIARDLHTSLAIAQKHDDRAEMAFSLLRFGCYHTIVTYDYASALTYLEQSFDYYQTLDDRFHRAVALLWLGICHSNATSLDTANAYLRQALALARESGNLYSASLILTYLAKIAIGAGEYAAAEDYCQEALAIEKAMNQRLGIAEIKTHLAVVHMLRGEVAMARAAAEDAYQLGQEIKYPTAIARALAVRGLEAGITGDYLLGRQLGEESLAIPSDDVLVVVLANWGLAIAYCGLQAWEMSRQYVRAALKRASRFASPAMMAWLLPVTAVILGQQGQNERAVEVLALAATHSVSAPGWLEQWPLLTALRAELEAELGAEAYAAAWERGKGLDMESVAAALGSAV